MHLNRRQSWMWAEACALLDEAERKHRHFFELLSAPAARTAWEPPADIFADGGNLEIVVALPGAEPQDVEVRLTPSGLDIETVVAPPAGQHEKVIRLEIPYGRMRRRIDLPAGRYVLVDRHLARGRLHLRLRRESV
ncbi:MAG TPA: Hsp20/alpha crystallin family protein [Steroidobacteraceae bacterium]|jgi:HSP20 family molecular chaperone IbpA|nr:Hsp20/alpha crystallin family protein [Steroidobacteraceae bacterium]